MPPPAFLFDLDGTLVDSVYQHVSAWNEALDLCGISLSVWRIHRRIGMSGGLFLNALQRETGLTLDAPTLAKLSSLHQASYLDRVKSVVPLPGARELLEVLLVNNVPFAIATSGAHSVADAALGLLDLPDKIPVVTRDLVQRAKPDPDLFLAAAEKLGVDPTASFVVGDSVWDLLAARARPRPGYRAALGRVRLRRAPGGGVLPRLPGPRRPAGPPRRGGGQTGPLDGGWPGEELARRGAC